MNRDRFNIVVTGVGMVTPLGASRERTWQRLLAGDTGIQRTPHGLEARVHDFSLNGARSRMGDFALLAAREALNHAGLSDDIRSDIRIGCAVSQSKPVVEQGTYDMCPPPLVGGGRGRGAVAVVPEGPHPTLPHKGGGRENFPDVQLLMSHFFGWSPAQVLIRDLHLSGPAMNAVAACATGVASIAVGMQWLRNGVCDAVLVGAAESSLNDFYRAGFQQMGVLAPSERGASAVRPFDRDRSGFAMGEGAAVMVLENEAHARNRGAKPLVQVTRTVLRQSVGDALRFDEDGSTVSALVRSALLGRSVPDYINAHGTATVFNDAVESRGIQLALGCRAAQAPISSTKAATGHLLGAAGAVEAAITVLALRDQHLPPTLNLESTDCAELDYIPHHARRTTVNSALSLSYGFGGQMGVVLFDRCR